MEAAPPIPVAAYSSEMPENAAVAVAAAAAVPVTSRKMPNTIESIAGVYASYPCSLLTLFSNGSALLSWVCHVFNNNVSANTYLVIRQKAHDISPLYFTA